MKNISQKSQIIIYKTENGQTKIDVRFDGETAWLTQSALAPLGWTIELLTILLYLYTIYIVNIYNNNMLDFKSKVTEKILGFYFLNTEAKKYINELAKIIDADPGNLDRKLKELEGEGVLSSEFSGKERYYSLNPEYPLLKELKKIYLSKYGLAEMLKKRFVKLAGLCEAYIYGSYAKKNFSPESDIDLLLIGSHSALKAQAAVSPLEKQFQREFNIVDLTEEEFSKKKKNKNEFIADIFAGEVIKII